MSFFEDDEFEAVVRELIGATSNRRVSRENEENMVDFIKLDKKAYIIIELPGFAEKDVAVSLNNRVLKIHAKKKSADDVKEYLSQKLSKGVLYERTIPASIDTKNFDHSFRNGILEISFKKSDIDEE